MNRVEPYHYVRWTWRRRHTPTGLVERLKEDFDLSLRRLRAEEEAQDISPYVGQRWEILVKADTLAAFLSAWRAVLFQRSRAPFTRRDMELREIVLKLYPRNRPTPFPWSFSFEPPFEVEEIE
ncbi:MAG: hypothetical protein ACETVR_02510 [Candidatus Bathyarchaeia archaeon]